MILLGIKTTGKVCAFKLEELRDESAFMFLCSKWTDKYRNSYPQGLDLDIHIGKPEEYHEAIEIYPSGSNKKIKNEINSKKKRKRHPLCLFVAKSLWPSKT